MSNKKNKKISFYILLMCIFAMFFTFFLYITFPYDILKEKIISELSVNNTVNLKIESLSPNFPLGFNIKGVKIISKDQQSELSFDEIDIDVSVLSLLVARVSIDIVVTNENQNIEISSSNSIFDLMNDKFLPKSFEMQSKKFPLEKLIKYILVNSGGSGSMMGQVLSKIDVKAKLKSNISLSFDGDNIRNSKGGISINLLNAKLILDDPSIKLNNQVFEKSQLLATLNDGTLLIDKKSGFISKELKIKFKGEVKLNSIIERSSLNVRIFLELMDELKDKYSFLLGSATGNLDQGAKLKIKVGGNIDNPLVVYE